MLLVRVTRPSYRNASQPEEDGAYKQEDHLRARLLAAYQNKVHASCGANCTLTLVKTVNIPNPVPGQRITCKAGLLQILAYENG